MRITRQLLKKHSSSPLEEVKYIDLSRNDIVAIERLELCKGLQTLILSNNVIDSVRNIYCCRHIWNINLTGNRVKSISGLSRYPVLGMLNLSYNDLDWNELRHLSHMTILCLNLTGNGKLNSDPNYREHVIDMLPHVWMLDGRLISAEEKKSVSKFFLSSQSSAQPVRHKASESVFVPTSMKNLLVTGVFGKKTTHLMARFPVNYTHNTDMDKRRLMYLAYSLQEEIQLQQQNQSQQHTNISTLVLPDLELLIEQRHNETEQSNMLLLLMLAYMEYDLPLNVMKATLETAKLIVIGNVNCERIFHLPAHLMLDTASLLLSAAAVDRQEKKEGGLYDQLYMSLCNAMDSVQKKVLSEVAKRKTSSSPKSSPVKETYQLQCRCLLASEVIHLMCLVPLFFESMESSKGLMRMMEVATKTPNVADVIGSIAWKVQAKGGDLWEIYHDVASYLLKATSANVMRKRSTRKAQVRNASVHRTTSQLLTSTQPKSPGRALRALSAGAVSRRLTKRVGSKSATYAKGLKEPELGDLVLVNANQVARIVALPETGVAVLQMNSRTTITSPPDSYFYTDTHGLVWDRQLSCWTKDNLAADLSKSRHSPSPPPSTVALPSSSSLDGSVSTLRMETPDLAYYHSPPPHARPISQLSYRSEDLETIHSQDEFDSSDDEDVHGSPTPPLPHQPTVMRVDIATSNTAPPVGPHFEHQRHVLQQYSAHNLHQESNQEADSNRNESTTHSGPSTNNIMTSTDHSESLTSGNILSMLTPKVNLGDTWEAGKSLPLSSHSLSSRPHSCHQAEALKLSSKIEPHMLATVTLSPSPSPTHAATTYTRPPHHSAGGLDTNMITRYHTQPAVMYDAWAIANPSIGNPKHTLLSSSRLMSKRQPKPPPVTRNSRASSGYRPESRSSGSTPVSVILQQRKPRATPTNTSHMHAYRSHAQVSSGMFHYKPPTQTFGNSGIRRLGEVKHLYIGGTSIG